MIILFYQNEWKHKAVYDVIGTLRSHDMKATRTSKTSIGYQYDSPWLLGSSSG